MRCSAQVYVAALAVASLSIPSYADVAIGMRDTFETGTAGWSSGPNNPTPPAQQPSGGPAGALDAYLLLRSNGTPGSPGGRLVAFSGPQWNGDYIGAGITHIRMDANNQGSTDLSLRLFFEGAGGSAYSTTPVLLEADGGWRSVSFATTPAALSPIFGNPESALSNSFRYWLYHGAAAAAPISSAAIEAQLGIDNISAVPEPRQWLLLAAGLAVVGHRILRRARGVSLQR
jgi:hypothetical protein